MRQSPSYLAQICGSYSTVHRRQTTDVLPLMDLAETAKSNRLEPCCYQDWE
jgi:hypothetical protein